MNTNSNRIKDINTNSYISVLVNLALQGLEDMYIPLEREFAMKKIKVNDNILLEGKNIRYTLINLIGLKKAEDHNFKFSHNIKDILNYQISNSNIMDGVGEIGLLLWATSLIEPDDISKLLAKINFNTILSDFDDAKCAYTMELSWLLTGLLLASTFNKKFKEVVGDLTKEVYKLIRNNYGGSGIFRHENERTLKGKIRGKIGSFADQVYPIYAFTLFSQQQKNEEALQIAKECTLKITEYQGKNGEWMWHYDASNGKLINKYPVYSVHQDAMAPFVLFAIQKASGINFEENILRGLNWLEDNNSLNVNMIDRKNNAVWRRIAPKNSKRKLKSTFSLLGINTKDNDENVEILYECWSYHLGWVLYAFAGRIDKFNYNVGSLSGEDNSEKNGIRLLNLN